MALVSRHFENQSTADGSRHFVRDIDERPSLKCDLGVQPQQIAPDSLETLKSGFAFWLPDGWWQLYRGVRNPTE